VRDTLKVCHRITEKLKRHAAGITSYLGWQGRARRPFPILRTNCDGSQSSAVIYEEGGWVI
jgi:hypothetical protein